MDWISGSEIVIFRETMEFIAIDHIQGRAKVGLQLFIRKII